MQRRVARSVVEVAKIVDTMGDPLTPFLLAPPLLLLHLRQKSGVGPSVDCEGPSGEGAPVSSGPLRRMHIGPLKPHLFTRVPCSNPLAPPNAQCGRCGTSTAAGHRCAFLVALGVEWGGRGMGGIEALHLSRPLQNASTSGIILGSGMVFLLHRLGPPPVPSLCLSVG